MPTKAQMESLRDELRTAPHGTKRDVVTRWAATLGVSESTLYRHLNTMGVRGPTRARAPQYPEYREWAQTLMDLMARSPEGSIPLHLCLRAALTPDPQTGEVLLPPAAGRVHISVYQRIIRDELHGRETQRRLRRMCADYPNQAWQLDATTSKYLIVSQELDDGDYLLDLWRAPMPASGYKNKPLKVDRLRLHYYGIWDMRTGYKWCTPQIARGESGLDCMQALCDAMQRRDDPRDPLHGVPEDLWSDQGVLTKHAATRDLLERLEINVITGDAYRKERMGGIEQIWRRLWQSFEQSLFLCAPGRGKWSITLSALQTRLNEYLAEENGRASRADASLSRRNLWVKEINQRGGAKLCPDRPMETIAQEKRCKVDGHGLIRWDNIEYEVPDLTRCWVIARRALDGSNRVIVEDETTGKRWDCSPFVPYAYAEHLRSPILPIEQARERAAASTHCPGDVYAPSNGDHADNVVTGRFGPRAQPAAPLPDPLDAAHYASLPQAMAAFYELFGAHLTPQNHAAVEQRILDLRLAKTAVAELAATLRCTAYG